MKPMDSFEMPGFEQSHADLCVFRRIIDVAEEVAVVVHIDGTVACSASVETVAKL